MSRNSRARIVLALALSMVSPVAAQQTQGLPPAAEAARRPKTSAHLPPIRLVVDTHIDPWSNTLPVQGKWSVYHAWIDNLHWVLDQAEPLGVKLGFNASGPWLQLAHLDGTNGAGAALLRRIYENGGQIGSHGHTERWEGGLDWPPFGYAGVSFADERRTWEDALLFAELAIATAFDGTLPEPMEEILTLKEYHLPNTEAEVHQLFQEFQIPIRCSGGMWDFLGWYDHYVWTIHRPSVVDPLQEDLNSFTTAVSIGRILGLDPSQNQGHDVRPPRAKRLMLQLYINWRHDERAGAPHRPWCFGWAIKPEYYDPGSSVRADLVDVLGWFDTHFAQRVEPSGAKVMEWSTHTDAWEAYLEWEAAHPGVSAFHYTPNGVDWDSYPYLKPVAAELEGFDWVADLSLGAEIEAFHLRRGTADAVLLWRDSGASTHDLSSFVSSPARIVDLESGTLLGADPEAVNAGSAPLLVTETLGPGIP